MKYQTIINSVEEVKDLITKYAQTKDSSNYEGEITKKEKKYVLNFVEVMNFYDKNKDSFTKLQKKNIETKVGEIVPSLFMLTIRMGLQNKGFWTGEIQK